MKLYFRLAVGSMRNNSRLYGPYLLAAAGMVMMFYIVHYLAAMPLLDEMAGGRTARTYMGFGTWIVALFALIFLFYVNSFLMRRQRREFGLYNILGMSRHHLALVFLWQVVLSAVAALGLGLVGGIALSKLAELALTRVLFGAINPNLYINLDALWDTLLIFAVVFGLLLLRGLWQIWRSSAIALLHSEQTGERPPRAHLLLGLAGAALLAAAYKIAVSIRSPLTAAVWFFIAVAMVIVATYLLFIVGSVTLCRILQRHKGYYYRKNHFFSVASMVFRMKRNGAGLASVCILSTMVLVMITGAGSLYFGAEDSLTTRYPRDINLSVSYDDLGEDWSARTDALAERVEATLAAWAVTPTRSFCYSSVGFTGLLTEGYLETDSSSVSSSVNELDPRVYDNVCQVYLLPLADYNRLAGTDETLAPGEALIYCYRRSYDAATLDLDGCYVLTLVGQLADFPVKTDAEMDVVPSVYLVVPDLAEVLAALRPLESQTPTFALQPRWQMSFDTDLDADLEQALAEALQEEIRALTLADEALYSYSVTCREQNRADFYAKYGGLFFLGALLTVVFLLATVLIIYYKQITEGYEDQARFEMMQKLGMTRGDIRRSVNSQMLTVFALPLGMAVLHLSFALPMIHRVLALFALQNLPLLLTVAAVTALGFALAYGLIYALTTRAYYRIVVSSDGRRTA